MHCCERPGAPAVRPALTSHDTPDDSPGELRCLLARFGIDRESVRPLPSNGYSGAALFTARGRDGLRWVIKRTSIDIDWIMRATHDWQGREHQLAGAYTLRTGQVRSAAVDSARDGDVFSILMEDITPFLSYPGKLSLVEVDVIVRGIAGLHRRSPELDVDWCRLDDRLLLLRRGIRAAGAAAPPSLAEDVRAGWSRFAELAPGQLVELIAWLESEFAVLMSALSQLPQVFVHNDLKLDNIGVDPDGVVWLIDWAMAARAPACVELGWFLAANATRMTVSPEEVLDLYAAAAGLTGGTRRRHDALTALCGLVLRGWRRALDVRSIDDIAEFRWWCDQALVSAEFLDSAANRKLVGTPGQE